VLLASRAPRNQYRHNENAAPSRATPRVNVFPPPPPQHAPTDRPTDYRTHVGSFLHLLLFRCHPSPPPPPSPAASLLPPPPADARGGNRSRSGADYLVLASAAERHARTHARTRNKKSNKSPPPSAKRPIIEANGSTRSQSAGKTD